MRVINEGYYGLRMDADEELAEAARNALALLVNGAAGSEQDEGEVIDALRVAIKRFESKRW